MNIFKTFLTFFIITSGFISCSETSEGFLDDLEENKEEAAESIKEVYQSSKNEICKMVNGKIECAKREIENDVRRVMHERR